MHRILIVDEDEHLLWALEKNLFPERDDLVAVTAATGEEGMNLLKQGDVDLLVSDIKMPGKVDGFQLILRAKEIAPDARVVIMTAFGSGSVESFADRMGITHYIEKPFNISDLRDMTLDLLDEKEGFQGMLSDLELTDIIQMLCLAKRTTLLHLKHKDHRGKIVFEQGDVVHAEFDDQDGAEAVYEMLVLRQGDIFMESDVDYDQRTIEVGWQDLLMESLKRADEKRLAEASQGEDGSDDSTPFSSFRPSESAEIEVDGLDGAGDDGEPHAADSRGDAAGPRSEDTDGADGADGLAGDSFFTEDELEELGMASSAAVDEADVFAEDDVSASPDEADRASRSAAVERIDQDRRDGESTAETGPGAPISALGATVGASAGGDSSAQVSTLDQAAAASAAEPADSTSSNTAVDETAVAADGGQRLGDGLGSSHESDGGVNSSTIGILETFVDECDHLRLTGIAGLDETLESTFVETACAGAADAAEISDKILSVVRRGQRVVAGLAADGGAVDEVQLTFVDAYVVMCRVGDTGRYHFAVVSRQASLGVVLVLMRQCSSRLFGAVDARGGDSSPPLTH